MTQALVARRDFLVCERGQRTFLVRVTLPYAGEAAGSHVARDRKGDAKSFGLIFVFSSCRRLGLKNSSRDLQINCTISFCFYLYLILYAYDPIFDMTGNLEKVFGFFLKNVTTGAEGSVKHVKLIHFCRQRLDFVSCGPRLLLDPRVILVHHYMVTQEVRAELKISRHFIRPVSTLNV